MVTYMMVSSSGVLVPLSPSRQGPSPPCSAEICVVSLTEERSHTPGLRPLDGGLFQKGNSISSQTRSFILEDSVTLTEKTHGISSRQPSISWLKCLVGLSNSLLMSKVKSIYLSIYLSIYINIQFSSVQSLSRVRLFATPWTAARQASLSITNSQSSLKLMCIESVMPFSHLILRRLLLLLHPSQHQDLFQ